MLISLPVDGHSVCSQFLVLKTKTALIMQCKFLYRYMISFLPGKYL